jgi:Tfp pilus assembly protein PilO
MNLSPRNKLIVLVTVCLIGTVALAAVLVFPAFQRIGTLDSEIEDAVMEADGARLLLDQRRAVKDRAAVTSTELVQLSVAIPETPEMPSLIIDLHDTAHEAGVVLRAVVPGPPTPVEGVPYIALPLQIEIHGTWADTIEFLRRASRLTRQIRINSIACDILPEPSPEELAATGLTYPPYYQIRTAIIATSYTIPASSLVDTPAAEAPAAE